MLKATKSAKFFRAACAAALFAFLAVTFSAYTRLSEAVPDCAIGEDCARLHAAPMTPLEYRQVLAQDKLSRSLNQRAWKDVVSRYLAGALGLLLLRMAVLGWQLKKRKRSQQIIIPSVTLGLVFGLTIAGLLTIDRQFKPLILMMQLLGGMTVLGLLWWIALREQRFFPSVKSTPLTRSLRPRVLIALAIVGAQITLGGWSMVNYAAWSCPDFPVCQGVYLPDTDFVSGLTLWRDVGMDYENALLDLRAATAIHMAHRIGAVITLLYVGWLALHVLKVGRAESFGRYGLLLFVILSCVVVLGVIEAVSQLPLAVAVLHNAAAALLLLNLVALYHVLRAPRMI